MKYLLFILFIGWFSFTPPPFVVYFCGEFKVKKMMNYQDQNSKNVVYLATSILYADSVAFTQTWKSQNLGQVSYNDKSLNYNNAINLYLDVESRIANNDVKWQLKDSQLYGSFTTTINSSFPNFSYSNCMPSVMDKSKNFVVSIDSTSNVDAIEITFFNKEAGSRPFYRKHHPHNGPNKIIISRSDMQSLTGSGITVTISLIKNEYKRINSKNFKFEKRFDFVKSMPLLN